MKKFSKIMSLVLAVMMVMVATMAFAAGNTPTSDNDTNAPAITVTASNSVTLKIPKDIVLFNVDGSNILEPNVTYTYTVKETTVTNGTTVTGKTVVEENPDTPVATVAVRSGIKDAVTILGNASGATAGASTTLIFGTDNSTKKNTYKEGETVGKTQDKLANKELTITINADTIYATAKAPGIFRYEIEDTTSSETLLKAGIKRDSNYIKKLYLDVYTKNNATGNGLEIYGYVLFKDNGSNASQSFVYASTVSSETIKVSGYDVESENGTNGTYDSGSGIISDQYHTYNVLVKKTITGDMADKNHQFPFKVEITNTASTIDGYIQQVTSQADFYYVATLNGTEQAEQIVNLDNNGAWSLDGTTSGGTLKFKNNDQILITGLPVNALVKVTEVNDTVDSYTASAKDTEDKDITLDNDATTKVLSPSTQAAMKAAFAIDNTSAKDTITVTNNLESISPTGYVTRFAPYALILIAGIALMVVSMKKRKTTEEV